MDKLTYNQQLKGSLNSKHPALLFPVRLETRYVHTGSIYSPLEEALNETLIQVNIAGNNILTPFKPSEIFNAGTTVIDRIETIGRELETLEKAQFAAPAFYKISLLDSRLSSFATKSIQLLGDAHAAMWANQAAIDRQVAESGQFVHLRQDPEAPALPYVLNKRLEKAAGEISEAVSHPEDIDLLSATALLQRQKKLLELLTGYRSAIAGLHSVNAEDQRALQARNQRLLSLVRAWNAATEPAITKYESAAELLNQKFAGAKDRVAGFQTAYVEPAGFGNLSAVWKKIDRYKTETEAALTTGKPATGTPATLVQELENLKMLGKSLESIEVQSLDPVVLQDLALAFAAGHQQTQDAGVQGTAGNSRSNALFTLLQAQVAQLEQSMRWDDCGAGAGISEQTWENLKRLKIQLEAALADVDDLRAEDTAALLEALLQLTEAAAGILEILNGLANINCADCPGLEAMVQHLPAALAQRIPKIEMLLRELKRQEGLANELLDQIKNQVHTLSEKYLADRFAFLKQLQDLQYLLDTLHSTGANQPTALVLDQVAQINEKLGSLLLEIPGLEQLPASQIYQAAVASGAVDAIALYGELLHDRQGRLDSLCSDIDFYIDQLNKCLDKQPSNCNSALAPVLQPEIEFLIEKIKQSEAQLNHCGGAETAFILSVQEYITKTVSSILIHIAPQHFLDEKDVEQIRPLISQLTEALHSWKDKIMSAEKAESRAFKKWKEIRQLLIKKNAELEQLMQIEQKAPDWFLVLKTHTTLRLYSQAPALFSMETRLSFSGQLMRTGQVYERQLEGIRNLPQNQKPTLLRELNAALNALKTAPDNLPDSYPRTAATLETLAGQLGQFRFPEIRENGQAEAETDTSAVLKNILDAQEALLRLRLCNRNYTAIQQAAAVLARQFSLFKQVLSTYKPRTGSSLAQVQSALERLLAHYREWERPNKSFLQQAGQSAQNLWENRQILLRTGTSLIDRLVSMPVSEAAQEETPPPGNPSGSRGKRASKDIKLPVWSYQIIPGLWELWIRIFPDEIAIDYHDPAFTSDELEAGKVYWRTIWDEPDGPALQEVKMGLWRSLVLRFGEQRAAYIIRTLEPTEAIPQDNNTGEQTKTGGQIVVTQLVFPEVSIKETAWSKAPVSYVMPDRFVFALYETEDSAPDLHFGADTVPKVLVAGIDPSDDDALEEAPNGELRVGPELKWTVDFSDAVAKGMAITIELSGPDQAFAKIVALGLKTRTVKNVELIDHSRDLLEKLFTGHHYASGGMAFVPPGTPTNNTSDGDAAYSMFNEDSVSFQTELTGDTFTLASNKAQKADGQVLAEALGLDPALFQHIHQADGFSSRNAGVMNYCLWQTTLGYFLEEMFAFYQTGDHLFNTLTYDKVDNKDLLQNLDAIRDYMATHVTGRGALPSIRVGDQPYGFLPIGVYHQSDYVYPNLEGDEPALLERPFFDETGDESGLTNSPISGYGGLFNWSDQFSATFCRNLLNILLGMKAKWLQAARQIQTVDDPLGVDEAADPSTKQQIANDRFMRILGLHAHAQSYDNRYSVGTDDAALKNQIFPDNGFTETQLLGYKGLFFTVPQNYWMTVLDWNWVRNFTINGTNTQFNDNAGFLTIAHLRHLDFPAGKPNTMQGLTVDALKASEKRLLSKISETSNQNYIDWLVQSPIKSVLKATIEGSMPSKSLLYLLLSNSYLNYAWDAGMRIYANMGSSSSGIALRENVFARLPRLLFPTWSFVGSTWSQVKSYVDGLYPDQEKQRLAADVLNFVIDSQKLYGNTNTLLSFQINAAHKLVCQHQNGTDTTSNLTSLLGNTPLSDFAVGNALDRKSYNAFVADWDPRFLQALKLGAYKLDWSTDPLQLIFPLPTEIATSILKESNSLAEGFSYLATQPPEGKNQDDNGYNILDELYFLEDPSDTENFDDDLKLLIEPIKYMVRNANSRLYFLLRSLGVNEVPGVSFFWQGGTMPDNSMAHYLKRPATLNTHYAAETAGFKKLLEQLPVLSGLPTAELERLMAEHLDLCSHRLDAWLQSLVNRALSSIRSDASTQSGSYIGAFGYLINLKRGAPRKLASDNSEILVDAIGDKPRNLVAIDGDNQGFIHAPSINHAITAAVMRASYAATGSADNSAFEINLESNRVKKALWLLDGVRNGQPLGALLGYLFERSLHEVQLDGYIYNLREIFPLVSGTLVENAANAIETVEANNVLDGLKLLEAGRGETIVSAYVTFFNQLGANETAFTALVEKLENAIDAVSDLVLSESVFQVSRGNFPKASAVQHAMNAGLNIPEIDIVKTPRTGNAITHRVAVLLDANSAQTMPDAWPETATPRAAAEPALNKWLGEQIGDPASVQVKVRYTTVASPAIIKQKLISLYDLDIQPIDLVMSLKKGFPSSESELGRLFRHTAIQQIADDGDELAFDSLILDFEPETAADARAFCAAYPMLEALAKLVSNENFLNPEHLIHPAMIESSLHYNQAIDINELSARVQALYDALGGTSGLLQQLTAQKDDVENDVVGAPAALLAHFRAAWRWGVAEALSHPGAADAEKTILLVRAETLISTLQGRLDSYDQLASNIPQQGEEREIAAYYINMAKALLGQDAVVLPVFELLNPEEVQAALTDSAAILPTGKPLALETWLCQTGRIRPKVGHFEHYLVGKALESAFDDEVQQADTLQLPYRENDHWVGEELPADYFELLDQDANPVNRDKLSLIMLFDSARDTILAFDENSSAPAPKFAGLIFDEWQEVIPNKEETTGIAFNYDQPNAEAPQTVLVAVPPVAADYSLDYLLDAINATFDLAKIRAVEPEHLAEALTINNANMDHFLFSHPLPAVLARVADFTKAADISADFNINNSDTNPNSLLFPFGNFNDGLAVEVETNTGGGGA